MRTWTVGITSLVFSLGVVTGTVLTTGARAQQPASEAQCGPEASAQLRTTLYFGLARPKGAVS